MNSMQFDSVKVEKANAVARYNRVREVAKLFQTVEIVVALALLSWWSDCFPVPFKISGEICSHYLFSPHFAFLIGNAIVVALLVLSRHNDDQISAGEADRRSEEQFPISGGEEPSPPPPPPFPEQNETPCVGEKRFVYAENVVGTQPQCDAVAKAIEQARRQIQRFQRTHSQKSKPDITPISLRRSETEMRRIGISSGERRMVTSLERVDSLSNEQFQVTIESFIRKQRQSLLAQKMAEMGSQWDDISN